MRTEPPVDVRGPRFAAILTTVVLAATLVTEWWPLLAAQTVVFATGAFIGIKQAPYALLYRYLVAPRLGPVQDREETAPLRFAQGVGFAFGLVGTIGYVTGSLPVGITATGLALFAAFLNAAFNLCLGCEMYLLLRRWSTAKQPS